MNKETLKKYFPFSFTEKKDVFSFVVILLVHVGAGAVISAVTSLLSHIPLVGLLAGIVGGVLGLYVLAGIVLTVLDYTKVIK